MSHNMGKPLRLVAKNHQYADVLQLTDCHLEADDQRSLAGINTRESLQAVLQQSSQQACDLTLVTGDIANGGNPAAYRVFHDLVERYVDSPLAWLPGNHDDPAVMAQTKSLDQVFLLNNWAVILLNSKQPNKSSGFIGEDQLNWLEQQLRQLDCEHILITLHHHCIEIGSRWIDDIMLDDREAFWARVTRNNNQGKVKAILSGHVHQASDLVHQGCRVITSPSTCIQFACNSDDFALADHLPGYRMLRLHEDGRIQTNIVRIQDRRFQADLRCQGY